MASFLSPSLANQNNTDEISNDVKRWSSPVFDQTQIVGLDGDADKIKGWLFGANDATSVIGIVGMGGLGKTTTAQKVFNEKQVEDHFEKRMWVSVSQTFVEEEIMRSMLKNLGDASIGDVARRMGVVEGRIHRPSLLTMEESWSLFCKIAFAGTRGVCQDPRLNEVGLEIVEKCGGLPLAIKAVGGVMFCKPVSVVEWRRIADNFSEELAQGDDFVMASLQLSYDELPTYLKPCFLCFVIYPEDCVILKDQLIHWWIGEGFLPTTSGRSLAETGEDCFMGLLNRCLVETVDRNFNGKIYTCKIHDMVRDLVFKTAEKEGFWILQDSQYRRLGLGPSIEVKHLNSNLKLRALVSTANKQECAPNDRNPSFSGEAKEPSDSGSTVPTLNQNWYSCLPQQLSELTLKFFPGEATPTWLNPGLLPELQCLSIFHGSFACFSTKFWGHGNAERRLHGLMLEVLPDLEADWARLRGAMPYLQLVSASWCPKLQAVGRGRRGCEEGVGSLCRLERRQPLPPGEAAELRGAAAASWQQQPTPARQRPRRWRGRCPLHPPKAVETVALRCPNGQTA
ncbi:hypothetical protein Taro_048949 [Colocasia esculenta]|uniref:NB-ARC domain-containing protein n=1 Tax=Colocasia esculenta TaxID=4460 RepID=A0A843X9L5_COLES|nr:hypothetical protein [Colocasia esculenta]